MPQAGNSPAQSGVSASAGKVDQDPSLQFDAQRRAGVDDEHMVTDHASGSRTDRPGLAQLPGRLEQGDVLTVWKLDRLGRSLKHLISVVDELGGRGVGFRSLTESLDTTTPGGRLLFHVMASAAQFEREVTAERTKAAPASARSKGASGPALAASVQRHSRARRRRSDPGRDRLDHWPLGCGCRSGAARRDRVAGPL